MTEILRITKENNTKETPEIIPVLVDIEAEFQEERDGWERS